MDIEGIVKQYIKIFSLKENRPDWAVKKKNNPNEIVKPPIPFIGTNYENTRLLLYASAENLTYYLEQEHELKHLDNDKIAINRHRYCFDNCSDNFFPHVHIEPINNGALLVVVAYVLNKIKKMEFSSPYELAENIAMANFGKFSISSTNKNIDYADNIGYLNYSLEYVEADLKNLLPDIIILPKTIYNHNEVNEMIKNIVPNALIIPIMQITPTTINTNLHKNYIEKKKLPQWIMEWHEQLPNNGAIKGKIKDNYYSIYSYLDEIIKTTPQHRV